jgi:hypothetical protein
MLARGDEPERRSFTSWPALWQKVRHFRWRWPRRSDFYIPAPVRSAWQALPPAPPPLRKFGTWFAATHTRNMELIGGWLADVLP